MGTRPGVKKGAARPWLSTRMLRVTAPIEHARNTAGDTSQASRQRDGAGARSARRWESRVRDGAWKRWKYKIGTECWWESGEGWGWEVGWWSAGAVGG